MCRSQTWQRCANTILVRRANTEQAMPCTVPLGPEIPASTFSRGRTAQGKNGKAKSYQVKQAVQAIDRLVDQERREDDDAE